MEPVNLMVFDGYQITVNRLGIFQAREPDADIDPLEAETFSELRQKIARLEENKSKVRKKAPQEINVDAWIYGDKGSGYKKVAGWWKATIRRVGTEKSSYRSRPQPILLVTVDGEKTAIQSRLEEFTVVFPGTDDEKRLVLLLNEHRQLKTRLEEVEDNLKDANKWQRMPVRAVSSAEDAPVAQAELVKWLKGEGRIAP